MASKRQHSRYYDTWFQAVLAWCALALTLTYCAVKKPKAVGRHAAPPPPEPPILWPSFDPDWHGADDAWAGSLRSMNEETLVLRDEVRA